MTDPRAQPGFQPLLFPQCDHRDLSSVVAVGDPAWTIQIEFLSVYYEINLCAARLRAVRERAAESIHSSAIAEAEDALERAICAKESLDVRYESRGVTAGAHWNGTLFDDVTFSFPWREPKAVRMCFGVPRPVNL